jgi:glycosyltransferase involved in cell wall biosynthesis
MVNIGYVGRLSRDANVRLLRDVEEALEDDVDVRFTIVGDGSEREWLTRHMLRARFTGTLRGEALVKAYGEMDIFACPSGAEGGDAVLEAMAYGVPVVAMKGGATKFLANVGRWAIVASDPIGFVEGVGRLARDRETREAMGTAARERALALSDHHREPGGRTEEFI